MDDDAAYEMDLTHITDTPLREPDPDDVPVILARPDETAGTDALPARYGRL